MKQDLAKRPLTRATKENRPKLTVSEFDHLIDFIDAKGLKRKDLFFLLRNGYCWFRGGRIKMGQNLDDRFLNSGAFSYHGHDGDPYYVGCLETNYFGTESFYEIYRLSDMLPLNQVKQSLEKEKTRRGIEEREEKNQEILQIYSTFF